MITSWPLSPGAAGQRSGRRKPGWAALERADPQPPDARRRIADLRASLTRAGSAPATCCRRGVPHSIVIVAVIVFIPRAQVIPDDVLADVPSLVRARLLVEPEV